MARLTIKDPEVHRMAAALAQAHWTSMTEQVRLSIRAQFQRSQDEKQNGVAATPNEAVYSELVESNFVGEDDPVIQRVRKIVRRNRELVETPVRSNEVGDYLYGETSLPE